MAHILTFMDVFGPFIDGHAVFDFPAMEAFSAASFGMMSHEEFEKTLFFLCWFVEPLIDGLMADGGQAFDMAVVFQSDSDGFWGKALQETVHGKGSQGRKCLEKGGLLASEKIEILGFLGAVFGFEGVAGQLSADGGF